MAFFVGETTADRIMLIGRIVTMDAKSRVLPKGALCIEKDRIVAVVADPADAPASFANVTPIDTGGTIYPGLIELHNHLSYNFLPLWSVPRKYTNRNEWREHEPDYQPNVALPAAIIGKNADVDYPRSIARFVECRSLLGGVTTTQGLSASGGGGKQYYQGLTRNVEAPRDPIFPAAGGQTLDYSPAEIKTKLVPALKKDRPFFYHLSEGTDVPARQRFLDLEYESGTWAIDRDLITIHCTALEAPDYSELGAGAGMVWSPLSNLLLYGATADVKAAREAGVTIALGSDWSPSGSKNLLGELKIARIVSKHLGGLFSDSELVRMVTSAPARMLGWDGHVGSLERGKKADVLVLEGSGGDPYRQLVEAMENDLLAVLIDGRPRYGRLGLLDFDMSKQERIVVGGKDYCLDLTEAESDPLSGLSLATAIAKLTYGLKHLSDLASDAIAIQSHALEIVNKATMTIDFDLEPEGLDFIAMPQFAAQFMGSLKPLPMSPITAVDDPDYVPLLKANPNLPAYVRNAL
jgi:cytosine/adenosine deaminase-related metal-dependent hydrolase